MKTGANFLDRILTKRKLRSIARDTAKSAAAVDLIYVNDKQPGISRKRKEKGFDYFLNGAAVTDPDTIQRINSLVIPPAWENVWICPSAEGHLQATGTDAKNRKQYLYHPHWNVVRNQTKFFHLYDFGKVLPSIRQQVQADLKTQGLQLRKVLATIVSLMEYTGIRVGNNMYEKLYGSFGITTLQNKHVQIKGSELTFSFKGKKGVYHNIKLRSKKLAQIVGHCKELPGKELFQYYDETGARRTVDSGMVNNYIKEIGGGQFTSKDFRTWVGTLCALVTLKETGYGETIAEVKRKVLAALNTVASRLGNTRNVCRKYYVHPAVINHYENNTISKYFKLLNGSNNNSDATGLSNEERVLMKMLKESGAVAL
jgi:DNA topoisomerase-1